MLCLDDVRWCFVVCMSRGRAAYTRSGLRSKKRSVRISDEVLENSHILIN